MVRLRRLVWLHDGWAQGVVVLGALASYELVRLAVRPDWPLALAHAREVEGWERRAGIGWERSLQRAFLASPPLLQALDAFYLAGNFAITGVFFVWLYRRSRSSFGRYRNAFLLASAISLFIEVRFPAAPPRLAGIGVEDTLRRLMGVDIGSPGAGGLTDPVAAMPSLHAGWAFGVGVGVFRHSTATLPRIGALFYPVVVAVTVVVTGNHFVLDVLCGTAVVGLALLLFASSARLEVVDSRLRRGVEQSGSSPGS